MSKPLRVLIVEDDDDDAELLRRELRRGGYDLISERVDTPPAMNAALDRQDWDLVLADYSLPQFSSLAALAMLKDRGLTLPFIIVSGAICDDTAVEAMTAGAHDYLVKGRLARLVPAVERELREASERWARCQAELALQASERRFRSLIENSSGIIALIDPSGTVGYVSPPVEQILGYRQDELLGQRLSRYVHPEDSPIFAGFLEEVLGQPGVLTPVEIRIQHRDRSWRILGAMARNLVDDPGVQGIVINARDITDRKELEEQLRQSQKMEAIGRLAGGVAHDFNNMLGAITGYADLLLHRVGPDETTRDCLHEIIKASERATTLTRQLLLFGRKEVLAPQILDLGEVLASVQKMLGRLIGEDIDLVIASDPPLDRVKIDPGQIEQVVLNLAVNARDAMPDGGQITIETRNVSVNEGDAGRHPGVQPGAYVVLSVSDTGCGMDAETQSHIFEPFFTTKEHGKGTGLGLATVYGIVQQSGGRILVESHPGRGATFKIYLPRAEGAVRLEQAPGAHDRSSAGSETILLVEDEAIVRRLVQRILRMNGYTVLEAGQGAAALRLCEQQEYSIDLLLTDVVMPGMCGRELAERAAAVRPEMKVLFMSGYTDDVVVRHGVLDADIAFIQKPFTPAALTQKVRDVLGVS